jgi:hypothetical protein
MHRASSVATLAGHEVGPAHKAISFPVQLSEPIIRKVAKIRGTSNTPRQGLGALQSSGTLSVTPICSLVHSSGGLAATYALTTTAQLLQLDHRSSCWVPERVHVLTLGRVFIHASLASKFYKKLCSSILALRPSPATCTNAGIPIPARGQVGERR